MVQWISQLVKLVHRMCKAGGLLCVASIHEICLFTTVYFFDVTYHHNSTCFIN